jgi:hypothetical protein
MCCCIRWVEKIYYLTTAGRSKKCSYYSYGLKLLRNFKTLKQQKAHKTSNVNGFINFLVIGVGSLELLFSIILTLVVHKQSQKFLQTDINDLTHSVKKPAEEDFEQYVYGFFSLLRPLLKVAIKQSSFKRYLELCDLSQEFPKTRGFCYD